MATKTGSCAYPSSGGSTSKGFSFLALKGDKGGYGVEIWNGYRSEGTVAGNLQVFRAALDDTNVRLIELHGSKVSCDTKRTPRLTHIYIYLFVCVRFILLDFAWSYSVLHTP